MKYEDNTRYSKYKSEIKQTLVHVQSMLNTRKTSVEYKIVIIIGY